MKKITYKLFILSFLVTVFSVNAQQTKQTLPGSTDSLIKCGSDAYNANQLLQYPNMMGSATFENNLNRVSQDLSESNQRGGILRLPVVVHVVHEGEAVGAGSNISEVQILSQIQVLNEDYRRMVGTRGFNTDPNGADIEIEFFLAGEDPDCNPTNGINRVLRSSLPNSGADIDSDVKPATIWDSAIYINMWVIQLPGGLLGYAQFPGGPPESDGVVMGSQYFGSDDNPGVNIGGTFNLGRTTTHELGHYLGLFHTFQGGCVGAGDSVADTAPEAQPNYGCPVNIPDTCPGGGLDPIENYMDYSDDACMNIFTNGQNTRIQGVLGGIRSALANSPVPEAAATVAVDASISVDSFEDVCGEQIPNIKIANYGTTTLSSAVVTYSVSGGASNTYNWAGSLLQDEFDIFQLPAISAPVGAGTIDVSVAIAATDQRTCNDTNSGDFTVTDATEVEATVLYFALTTDDYSAETTWSFVDSSGAEIQSGGPYNGNSDDNTLFEFFIPLGTNECYTFTLNDSYGDGICCQYGNGSYELRETDAMGNLIDSGGSFTSSVRLSILANALSVNDYFANSNLYLYPNPTSNQINIKLANTTDLPTSYEIFNVLGQSITRNTIENNQDLSINTASFSNGAYFIKIIKDNTSTTIPFIKD